MANFDDVATNADIAPIADAIRRVTRTGTPMTIPEMPERLRDIRVIEVQTVQATLDPQETTIELFEYDDTIQHHFLITPAQKQDEAILLKHQAGAVTCSQGKCYLQYAVAPSQAVSFSLTVTDMLLASTETTSAEIVSRFGDALRVEIDASSPIYNVLVQDPSTGAIYRRAASLLLSDIGGYALPAGGIPKTDLNQEVNAILDLAEGAQQADSAASYSALVTKLLALDEDAYNVGQSIYIGTMEVPDVWVYSKSSTYVPYTYTTDAAFIADLTAGTLQVGYFTLYPLETEKVDLSGYLQKVGTVTAYRQAYCKNADGTQGMVDVTNAVVNNAIVQRAGDGQIYVKQTPTENSHATSKKYCDDTFLAKQTGTTTKRQAYCKEPDGTQSMVNVSGDADASTLVQRNSAGQINTATPSSDNHAINKYYGDYSYLAKQTGASSYPQLYCKKTDGSQEMRNVAYDLVSYGVPLRDSNGGIKVPTTPSNNDDAASKAYVDVAVGSILPTPPATDGTYTLQVTIADGVATYAWI